MFGYVIANQTDLTEQQNARYRGCYCGLCRAITRLHGRAAAAALTYDMAFLTLLLTALYEPEERHGTGRCAVHPVQPRDYWQSEYTEYCADLNVLLAYYNCLDDWQDDRKPAAWAMARVLRHPAEAAAKRLPRQAEAIRRELAGMLALEKDGVDDPDAGANSFGRLMAELFAPREDLWAPYLRAAGAALGRFIYLADAVADLEEDKKRGRYNALSGQAARGVSQAQFLELLSVHMGDCVRAYDVLPIVQDEPLLHHILYAGVWSRLTAKSGGKELEP